MGKSFQLVLLITIVLALASCDLLTGAEEEDSGPPDPLGPTAGRPGIPMPEDYQGEVPTQSEILVVEEAPAQYFNPQIVDAFNSAGKNLDFRENDRLLLVDGGEPVSDLRGDDRSGSRIPEGELQPLDSESLPTVQFIRYWERIGDVESFAGGAAVTREVTTTKGSSQTRTESFSSTTSVEASVSGGGLFASASVTASASYTATQGFSSTESTETKVTKTFTVSPRSGTNLLYSSWKLVEEIRYVSGSGVDADLFDVQAYDFNEDSVRFVYPTDVIVPVSAYYEK